MYLVNEVHLWSTCGFSSGVEISSDISQLSMLKSNTRSFPRMETRSVLLLRTRFQRTLRGCLRSPRGVLGQGEGGLKERALGWNEVEAG